MQFNVSFNFDHFLALKTKRIGNSQLANKVNLLCIRIFNTLKENVVLFKESVVLFLNMVYGKMPMTLQFSF